MFELVEKVTVCEPALMLPSLKKKKIPPRFIFLHGEGVFVLYRYRE